jgi:SAM-dependent methyltransferase
MEPPEVDYLRLHLKSVPAFRALLRSIECRLFAQLGDLPEPILDIGCGDGHFASIAFPTRRLVGIDLDPVTLAEAAARQVYVQVLHGSAVMLPLASATFATVISNCAIEHVPDLNGLLAEAHRVLQSNGRFIFGVPSQYFAQFLLGSTIFQSVGARELAVAYGEWFHRHSQHYHVYAPQQWQTILANHAFSVENWYYYMPPVGHRIFDLLHYMGVPNLITHQLTGRWTLWPPLSAPLFAHLLRPFYAAQALQQGAYIFFECRKVARAELDSRSE